MLPGTANTCSGVAVPYSRAAAIVTTLFTEPGSYGLDTAALPSVDSSASENARGSNVRALAMARTSPVAASSTTADPPLAPFARGVLGELALHRVLQVGVQRQLQVRTGRRGPLEPRAAGDDRRAALGRVHHPQPVLAGEQVVLRALQAHQPGELAGRSRSTTRRRRRWPPAPRPGTAATPASPRRSPDTSRARRAPRPGRPAARARRSPCRSPASRAARSRRRRSPARWPAAISVTYAAVPAPLVVAISRGLVTSARASTLNASGAPERSRSRPRSAGSAISLVRCRAEPGLQACRPAGPARRRA